MNRKYLSILLALLLVVVIGVVACGKKTETNQEGTGDQNSTKPTKTIKFGFIMPMSGPGSLWGEDIKRDADAYAAVLNEEGGVKIGDEYYNVENFYANDEGLPEKAAIAATQLVERDGVAAIVGYWGGGLPTMNSVTAPAKVLTLLTTQAQYDPKVMPYTAIGPDNAYCSLSQIKAILKAFPETKMIGISSSDPYFQNVFDNGRILPFFKEYLTEKGIGYFADLYPWETTDYTQHVEKLRQAGVDTIYSFGAPQQVAMTKKAIYESGYKVNFATSGTIPDLDAFIEIAGYEAAQGGLHTFYFPWELKNIEVAPEAVEMSLKIRDKHEELYNEEMTYDGAFAYGLNQMLMYIQAAQKAGTTEPDELMKVIEGGTFDLFLGTITLGGTESYGRAVFGAFPGAMGKLEGRKLVYASDEQGDMIP